MTDTTWLDEQSDLTLTRLLPRIETALAPLPDGDIFLTRLKTHFADAFEMYFDLYSGHYDFYYHLQETILAVIDAYAQRSAELKAFDARREADPQWFQSEQMMGAVCYVDLFAGNLAGIKKRIPYFEELGLTYLHLMPLFRSPTAHNDGGYAVSSFREVNPALGTMKELATLARELRKHGISLVLDFVFNHTSDEHDWALKALSGDTRYQAYYHMFDDRSMPDRYEPNLREIFPEQAPGSFTYRPEINKWVWTTFHDFQWDLNYANPEVFRAMLGEILFLGNQGAEVLRLDAVPFIWKQLGTSCENLPQTHSIIRGFNAFVRMAAPALLFKSEAIVHPRDVRSYIDEKECQLSYNPIMMVSIWDALATRDVSFFRHTMSKQFSLSPGTAWINYVRSHDDIGWGFADEDAAEMGINGADHRYFLNLFYIGRFPGSFASGLPFNFNPRTQDMRISGTTASLAGLDRAYKLEDRAYAQAAIHRIIMIHSLILSAGGIPLVYLGDEIGTINDTSYPSDPAKAGDSRWVHRPYAKAERYALRHDATTAEGQIFETLTYLIGLRKQLPALADGNTRFLDTGNPHVLGYVRNDAILILANFAEVVQDVDVNHLQAEWQSVRDSTDLITGDQISGNNLPLQPYQFMWLSAV